MEDKLLNKDIFEERDLFKLSPDYISDIPLRMEMRRNSVKDTHSIVSGGVIKNNNWSRKSVKISRDCYKYNKEIAKIRNTFSNMDLKNKLMLKYVDSLKPRFVSNHDKVLITGNKKEIEDEKDYFIESITDDMNNLVIQGDYDFKLNKKPDKIIMKNLKNDKLTKLHTLEDTAIDNNESPKDDVIRIECTYTYYDDSQNVELVEEAEIQEIESKNPSKDSKTTPVKDCEVGDNLSSLLIMMALTPKSNNCDDENENNKVSHFNDKNLNYQFNFNQENIFMEHYGAKYTIHDEPFDEDISNVLSVTQMRIRLTTRQETLLRKYVDKWRKYVDYKKEQFAQQRQADLDTFFDKLEKKKLNTEQTPESLRKAKLMARDYNTYQRRYKLQKHIIALQRAKLEEQNRMIEELKYNKIIEDSRKSVNEVREEVRKAYFEIDRQLKPKLKVLTKELNLQGIEEPSLVLHCLKVPQFLQRMEKRAREREEKHAMIRERRQQMEEERIRMKQQAEIARAEMDKEEKMRRLNELKEKRKREKIESIRKKQFAERMRSLTVMAELHYEKWLKITYGMTPFKILLEIRRDNIEKAKAHYVFQLKNHVFLNWMWYTEDMWYERNFKADDFHRKKLLRKYFDAIRRNKYQLVLKKQVADDYYDFYVTKLGFRKFREGIQVLRKEYEMNLLRAEAYHNGSLLFKTFTCWRTLPALNALKREQDARKARWREKVLQVVPDFVPPED